MSFIIIPTTTTQISPYFLAKKLYMTIKEQLDTVGHQLTVDGMEWQVEYNEGEIDGFYTLIDRKKVRIFWHDETGVETHFNKWILKYGAIFGGTPPDVHFTATTIEAACREAIRLCRERVSELAVALGIAQVEVYNNFLPVLDENMQAQIAGYYNDDKTDEERQKRNAVIDEYKDLILIYKHRQSLLTQPTGEKEGQA